MSIKTLSDKRNMSYQYYIKNPMLMVERRLNMIASKEPHLVNPLIEVLGNLLIENFLIYHLTINK